MVFSEKESKRFNKRIFRETTDTFHVAETRKGLIRNNVDVLILRLPSNGIDDHYKLRNTGFPFLHVDTLVYYLAKLDTHIVSKTKNDVYLNIIDDHQKDKLHEIIPVIFEGYKNHYFANPIFEPHKINQGYIEWAGSYINTDNRISWFVKRADKVVGFATCSFDEETKECEGVLYGVLPEFSGQGIYTDIIKLTQRYFKDKGYSKMWVSTQIQNYAVQKTWIKEGFFLQKSYETYHINSMLNFSINDAQQFSFKITSEDVTNFANFSGDFNALHFDDCFAQKNGFDSRITHGMIFQSYLSRFLGMDYPGNGTIFMENRNVFLAPIYPDKTYATTVNTLKASGNGIFDIIAKVYDEKGQCCLLSYNTLKNTESKIANDSF